MKDLKAIKQLFFLKTNLNIKSTHFRNPFPIQYYQGFNKV